LRTSQETIEAAQQFFTRLGKEPVIIRDCVGGVLPRVVASLINNAAYALMEGVASAADIDAAMKLGTNYPYGPLEWADKIGLDQVLGILDGLCEAYGQDRYRPAPILRQMVYAGHLGERTGRGFYEYP
ncbi:MAG: 3-hydroxybutyryl-CoA dehydrogenase, partial [Anaerolineae bacterium]